MLPDAALRSIADKLLHLKIAVAVVAPLVRDETRLHTADLNPPESHGPRRRVAGSKRHASKPAPTAPIPISYDARPSSAEARWPGISRRSYKRSALTLTHALRVCHDDAEAVVRYYRQPAQAPPRAFSHDARTLAFLKERLARGPCAADVVDDEIERSRLRAPSVEKAKAELGLVARRVNNWKGTVVHLCTAEQAAELEAAEA